jgi:D-sedoheptulose 7-phosphate isomerase
VVPPRDVVVAISSSGNSPNVLAVLEVARRAGAATLALTGRSGGQAGKLAEITVRVPSDSIEQVEDAHVVIAHSLCVALRQRLHVDSLTAQAPAWNGHVDTVIDSTTLSAG